MNLPTFTPDTVRIVDGKAEYTGSVSAEEYLGQRWIGEKRIGYLARSGELPVEGRWFAEGARWRFVCNDSGVPDFSPGETLTVYEGYWGQLAYMVLAPLTWTEQRYKRANDHDHCRICWHTIFADDPKYFLSSDRDIVCPACYERFVVPRSLDIIEITPR